MNSMSDVKNIMLCGVGGQGTILASKVLSTCLVDSGYDVKMSEIHGMSQRGGSVTTQVRYGTKVNAPIIGRGSADILVSFEAMEALRYLNHIKPDGYVVVNDYKIPSSTILSGLEEYPEDVIEIVKAKAKTTVIDAEKVALSLGDSKVMNIVLLGSLVKLMNLEDLDWKSAIEKSVKPNFIDINIKALIEGMNAV